MSNIVPFVFENFSIRVITDNQGNDPWFVAKDVCAALEITNHRDALTKLDEDERGVGSIDTPGGIQDVGMVNESGMYTLALRCRDAVTPGTLPYRFRKWVTGEVLPTIRKTGRYEAPAVQTPVADARISALKLTRLAMQAAKAFGFTGNHAALSADRAILTITGASPLALLGHEHLEANPRGQTYGLNELGKMLDPPITGVAMGKKLEAVGLRARDATGNLIPTEAANGLFEWLDTGKRSNHGTPVKQVKWFKDVLTHL